MYEQFTMAGYNIQSRLLVILTVTLRIMPVW